MEKETNIQKYLRTVDDGQVGIYKMKTKQCVLVCVLLCVQRRLSKVTVNNNMFCTFNSSWH